MIKTIKYSKDVDLEKELARSQFSYDDVNETVESILKDVKARGDKALIEYTEKFDGVKLENLEVTEEEIQEAFDTIDKELMDLGFGKCKFSIAGPVDFKENFDRPLIVATKYLNVAKNYFDSINRDVELIKLNGSIEIAPILGLSDVIMDIVETGTTLKENNLKVLTNIEDISARFVVNKSSYRFKNKKIEEIVNKIKEIL